MPTSDAHRKAADPELLPLQIKISVLQGENPPSSVVPDSTAIR